MSQVPVSYYRTTSSDVTNVPVTDGQIVLGTKSSSTDLYFDVGNTRLPLSSSGGGGSSESILGYGSCSSSASSSTKSVTITDNDFVLKNGTIVTIQFNYTNTNSAPQLSVTDSEGTTKTSNIYLPKYSSVYMNGSIPNAATWDEKDIISFVLVGSNWFMLDWESHIYIPASTSLSTSSTISVTFTNNMITSARSVDLYTSVDGLNPISTTVSGNSCVVVFPIWTSSQSVNLKLYMK